MGSHITNYIAIIFLEHETLMYCVSILFQLWIKVNFNSKTFPSARNVWSAVTNDVKFSYMRHTHIYIPSRFC